MSHAIDFCLDWLNFWGLKLVMDIWVSLKLSEIPILRFLIITSRKRQLASCLYPHSDCNESNYRLLPWLAQFIKFRVSYGHISNLAFFEFTDFTVFDHNFLESSADELSVAATEMKWVKLSIVFLIGPIYPVWISYGHFNNLAIFEVTDFTYFEHNFWKNTADELLVPAFNMH